jgi:translation initiation factor IF-3
VFPEGAEIARQLRTNERIRAREILLIGDAGERLGVMPVAQAINLAREADLDLVEVAPSADPPVCRILDHGRYKYEQSKKEREARKHQHHVVLREVRFKAKIDTHDAEFKARTAEKLLREGDKVKVSVMFRGREITHPQIGRVLLDRIYEKLKEIAALEKPPTMEGRFMSMILTPTVARPPDKQPKEAGQEREMPVASTET